MSPANTVNSRFYLAAAIGHRKPLWENRAAPSNAMARVATTGLYKTKG